METAHSALVRRFSVRRIVNAGSERLIDSVAVEEPLEIRIGHRFKGARVTESLTVTMRTPGQDRELAAGFLLGEGIIQSRDDLIDVRALGSEPSNEIHAEVAETVDVESWRLARATFVGSSCGICGKRSRSQIQPAKRAQGADYLTVDAAVIEAIPKLMNEKQRGFAQTGGLHAAALVSVEGEVEQVFEDIGRHNALDKLIGWCVLNGRTPLYNSIVFLSSRSSFELIQKTSMAGAPVLATVGGPSSLAVESARESGITLIGFVRDRRFNIYSGEWRVHSD